ncbi:PLDc N-terminal domain-containing protein [Gordonia neofelifaecis]|uniref:Cardiolipin synthase N-terminal domain-containing protein n=1 Tax=Gordonia neofelifaecis NRRL B-59395 TaxID=644548 RepID=F1YLV9_9ACTN|nr:PLDc N-terminal domain-containing protein [Gordonia neofelifaecis]EGD54210.1 hypothetical protein SCNU_14516 [Gordonia neofelifaecis NRRL B-59395]
MPIIGGIVLLIWIAALVDAIVTDEYRVRHLPKALWILIVILLPLIGSVLWLVIGRPEGATPPPRTTGFPEYERPEYRAAIRARDEAEFRRQTRERAEAQRRKAGDSDATDPDEPDDGRA